MNDSSTRKYYDARDSITITLGNTVYTVEHVYGGNRSIQDIMSDFLEREARNLDT